jgi:hypothetical protein
VADLRYRVITMRFIVLHSGPSFNADLRMSPASGHLAYFQACERTNSSPLNWRRVPL